MTEKVAAWPPLTSFLRQWGIPALRRRLSNQVHSTSGGIASDDAARVVLLGSITQISAEKWDSVTKSRCVTRSHAYFSAIEKTGIKDCRLFYPIVYDATDTILAHACVYVSTTDLAQLLPRWSQSLVRILRYVWPRLCTVRIVECATPLTSGSSISFAAGTDRAAVIACIEQSMVDLAARERSGLLVLRDFFETDRPEFDFLLERGYKCVSNLPLARIAVRWSSYDDYLDSMRSRYRKDIKRRLARALRTGRKIEVLRDYAGNANVWAQQATATHEKVDDFKREKVDDAYYCNMNAELGEHSLLLAVSHHDRHIAHGMVLLDAEQTIAIRYGREDGVPAGEWFQLMNELIRMGIERGSKTINLGLGSYDAKILVGADIHPLFVYTRCTNRALNAVIRLVPDLMKREQGIAHRLFRECVSSNGFSKLAPLPAADEK